MPSPLGHALGGLVLGRLAAGRAAPVRLTATFAVVGALPDLDLLVGAHSGPTHGLGAAVIAGAIAALVCRRRASRWRVAAAIAAAYASHTLLDWLSTDTSAPYGIMALWPFSGDYYLSPYQVFLPVSRRYWLLDTWLMNLRAVLRELLLLGPPAWLAIWLAREPR
jgi:inner membrane protein